MSTSRPMSNNNNNDEISLSLSSLSDEVKQTELYPRSPLSVLGLLARTSKQYEEETAVLRLLQASIHAAPEYVDANEDATALASIAILKKYPELLFNKKRVIDHYGREILASPYQIFLGAGDIWALKQVHEEILSSIKDNETRTEFELQAETQFKEQFPNCPWPLPKDIREEMLYDDRNTKQIAAIEEQLAIVKQCIDADSFTNHQPNDATKQAVEALCKLLQPAPEEVIQSGLHFPLAIVDKVYQTYNALRGDRLSFFTLAVIKPVLDALSTVDGQCCQGGLNELDMKKGPSRRCHSAYQHPLGQPLTLTFAKDKDKRGVAAVVDPYDGDVLFASSSGGFDWFNKNGALARRSRRGHAGSWRAEFWKTYGEQKQRLTGAIMRSHEEKSTHRRDGHNQPNRCVIL